MSSIFLDTSAYAAFHKGHSEIRYRLKEVRRILLSPVALGELHSGFLKGRRRRENMERLGEFLESPRVRVEPVDQEVAERYALILDYLRSRGTPIPTNDIWIAAGAMLRGASVLTTDRHYHHVVQVVSEIHEPVL